MDAAPNATLLATLNRQPFSHNSPIRALSFDPRQRGVWGFYEDGQAILWDMRHGVALVHLECAPVHKNWALPPVWLDGERVLLAVGKQHPTELVLWSCSSGKTLRSYHARDADTPHAPMMQWAAIDPVGRFAVARPGEFSEHEHVWVIDLDEQPGEHGGMLALASFDVLGGPYAVSSERGVFGGWRPSTGEYVLFDVSSRKPRRSLELERAPHALCFDDTAEYLILNVFGVGPIRWSLTTGEHALVNGDGRGGREHSVFVASRDRVLFRSFGSYRIGDLRTWSWEEDRWVLLNRASPSSIAVDDGLAMIATAKQGRGLQVHDLETGEQLSASPAPGVEGSVCELWVNATGEWLVASLYQGGYRRTSLSWELESGEPIALEGGDLEGESWQRMRVLDLERVFDSTVEHRRCSFTSVDSATGALRAEVLEGYSFTGPYSTETDYTITVTERSTGDIVWRRAVVPSGFEFEPVFLSEDGALLVRLGNNSLQWFRADAFEASPVIRVGTLSACFAHRGGRFVARDRAGRILSSRSMEDGALIAKHDHPRAFFLLAIDADGAMALIAEQLRATSVFAIDLDTGEVVARFALGAHSASCAFWAEEHVIIGTKDGVVFIFESSVKG